MNLLVKLTATLLSICALVSLVLILGEERERQAWLQDAPSTLHLYATKETCTEDQHILNCGTCGNCSNRKDIRIYKETANTMTSIMTQCSIKAFFLHFGSNQYTFDCLTEKTSLSDECAKCWVSNAICNKQNCLATCTKGRLFPFLPSMAGAVWQKDENSNPLDPCHACDENFCGPNFVACAGANRRRTGVVSDIDRDMGREMCTLVDWDYIMGDDEAATTIEQNIQGGNDEL